MPMKEKALQIWLVAISAVIGVAIPILWSSHLSNKDSIVNNAQAEIVAKQNTIKIDNLLARVDKLEEAQIKNDNINSKFDNYSKDWEDMIETVQQMQIHQAVTDQQIKEIYDIINRKYRVSTTNDIFTKYCITYEKDTINN